MRYGSFASVKAPGSSLGLDMSDDAGKVDAVDDLALDGIGKLVRHPHGPCRWNDHMQTDKGALPGSTCPERVKVNFIRAVTVQDLLYGSFGFWLERLVRVGPTRSGEPVANP